MANDFPGSIEHTTSERLQAGLAHVLQAPKDGGPIELVVRRPSIDARELLDRATFDVHEGLVGDSWKRRSSSRTADGSPHPDMQVTIMSSRAIALFAGPRERWALAGDQLFVDLDLSAANLPPGTRLTAGPVVFEVTAQPHTGCGKFVERFGLDALKFVNSPEGRALNLRGINARVVQGGTLCVGDHLSRIGSRDTPRAAP